MSNVAYLEDSDFTQEGKLLIDEPVICLIYANWCPPCIAFKPEFYKFAEMSPIAVACIEMDGHLPGQKELTDRVNFIVPELQGTPTVVVFVKLAAVLNVSDRGCLTPYTVKLIPLTSSRDTDTNAYATF